MYLSRLELEPYRMRKAWSSLQVMHAAIESAFEGGSDTRKLWRIDQLAGRYYLIVCSRTRPLTCPDDLGGTDNTWETVEYEPFLLRLKEGQKWSFRLRANPTRSISQGAGKRGKVYAHVTVDQQKAWLLSRAEDCGFVIPRFEDASDIDEDEVQARQFDVVQREQLRFKKKHNAKPIELRVATFEGVLEIRDVNRLRQVLCDGIGRAKAYGCGLLTLAPVSER